MRRLLRFRLRSFFLLVALLGIVVYPLATEWQTVRREQAAVAKFLPYTVSYEGARSPIARWVALPLAYVEPLAGKRIHRLTIGRNWAAVSNRPVDLRPLRTLQQLRHFEINDGLAVRPLEPGQTMNRSVRTLVVRNQGRSEEMHWLRGLPGVRSLAVRDAQLSSAAIENIAQTQVRSLEISSDILPPGGLTPLEKCQNLHTLRLYGIVAWSAPQLWEALPHLESLAVGNDWSGARDTLLAPAHATGLKELTIANRRVTVADAERIALQTNLRSLRLAGAMLSAEAMARLRTLPQLQSFTADIPYLEAGVWQELRQCTQLKHLHLRGTVSATHLAGLRSLVHLEQLELQGGSVNDESAAVLNRLPVQRVTLNYVTIKPQTRQRLEATRKSESLIILDGR